jgi:putative two-component system response regulator
LIIDDHQPDAMLLSFLIKKLEDVETYEFNEAIKAIDWCKEHEPDLVLVDYMMPNMDGIEFIKAFRALPNRISIPVVMVTAYSDIDVRQKALDASANDFINKPINNHELLARARNMLALRKVQLQLSNRAAWLAEEVKKSTVQILRSERAL